MKFVAKKPPRASHPHYIKRLRIWQRRLRERLFILLLIIQIFSLFVMPSVRAAGLAIPHIIIVGIFLIFVTFAIVLSRSRYAIATMIISAALTIIGTKLRQEQPDLLNDIISTTGQVLTQLSLLWVVSTAVFGPGRTTHHRILGAVTMYLAIGTIFTSTYILLAEALPATFTHIPKNPFEIRETLTYFSFSTLTTGSFGDIVPLHPIARSLANLESICGQLFPATLLARIVGLLSQQKSR
jgi:hypothetical protein